MNAEALTEAIKTGNRKVAESETQAALDSGATPQDVLSALVAGMDDVGRRFKANEIFVPEVLIAARAMKTAMGLLEPKLVEAGYKPEHKVLIGTVQGDLHDIGKNLVAMMWKGANFEVVDLGTNVSPQEFLEAVKRENPSVVGLSTLLTTTMPSMKDTVGAIREACGDKIKVVIGGAPITQGFADEIGADAFAPDAASAVDVVRNLVSKAAA